MSDAPARRDRFDRELRAAARSAEITQETARARDAADRQRTDDATAAARTKAADAKAADAKAADAKAADAKTPQSDPAVKPATDARGPEQGATSSRSARSSRDAGTPGAGDAARDTDRAAEPSKTTDAKTGSDAKAAPEDGTKAVVSEPQAAKRDDPAANVAIVLDAPPTVTTSVPVATTPEGMAGAGAGAPSPAAAAKAGSAVAALVGQGAATSTGDTEDVAPDKIDAGASSGFLATLSDGAPAPATPEAAKAALGPAATGTASVPSGPAPAQPSTPAVPLGQVPMTIGLRSLAGSSQFEIRLDPVDLGRIDVTLDIDKARGTVTTHLVVDRPDTLALLQRDAGILQQALSQAGLDPSAGGINLSLRSDGGAGGETARRDERSDRGGAMPGTAGESAATESAPLYPLRGLGGLDIRI